MEFSVGYVSIQNRRFYEKIPIYRESNCGDSQKSEGSIDMTEVFRSHGIGAVIFYKSSLNTGVSKSQRLNG